MLQKINSEFKSLLPIGMMPTMRFVLVKFGGGIIDMRGSIAGNTFARNRSGNYARARTKPINPNSTMQSLVRSVIAYLVERWSETLTQDQRDAWDVYATNVAMKNKLGETIHLSGFNHYIRSNANVCRRGETLYDDAPVIYTLPDQDPTLVIEPEVHENKCKLTFDDTMDWVSEDGAWLFINEGQPQNPQRNFFGGPYHGLKDKHGESASPITSPEWFTGQHTFGLGQKVWFRLRIQRADGRISEPWTVSNLVVAGPIA